MLRWRVDIIRNRTRHLKTVIAKTEEEAIAIAIKRFKIEPVRQNRIIVTKISARERLDQGGCARWPMGVCIRLLTRPRTHSVSRAASYVLLIEPAP